MCIPNIEQVGTCLLVGAVDVGALLCIPWCPQSSGETKAGKGGSRRPGGVSIMLSRMSSDPARYFGFAQGSVAALNLYNPKL